MTVRRGHPSREGSERFRGRGALGCGSVVADHWVVSTFRAEYRTRDHLVSPLHLGSRRQGPFRTFPSTRHRLRSFCARKPMAPQMLVTLAVLVAGAVHGSPATLGPVVKAFPGVLISSDELSARHVESVLALNPRDPQNLIAASMVFGQQKGVAVYASHDGGQSWRRGTQAPGGSAVFDGLDPAVAFDRAGAAYFLSIGDELVVWQSTDGGRTWGARSVVPGSAWDRPWIACDRSGRGPFDGRIYVAGKLPVRVFGHIARDIIAFSFSNQLGVTFPFPRLLLPAPEKALLNTVSDLLVAPNGRVIMVLEDFGLQNLRAPLLSGTYDTIVSTDGGRTFTEPRPGPAFRVFGHAREGKSLFALGGARIAIDSSRGSRRGSLYLTWLDTVDGYYHVMAATSSDGGETWSPPVRVSDNTTATDQSTPGIAVTDQGVVGVSWYDRRNDLTDGCYQLFFAVSTDGAATFSKNQMIDSHQTCPLAKSGSTNRVGGAPSRSADPVTSLYRFKNGGDTQGIVALPGGGFRLAWIGDQAGEMQLWSTTVLVRAKRPSSRRP
jgi:hypothetical protein